MTTVEAAQMWAEAKEAMRAAETAFESAKAAMLAAQEVERDAWDAITEAAGRTPRIDLSLAQAAQANGAPLTHQRARMNGGVIERE